jgi:gliding motility-associated-like protein
VTTAAGCSQRDSIRLIYLTPPTIYLGPDTTLCQDAAAPLVLDATLPGVRYRWQDGSTQATFQPTQSGIYWVTVSTAVCGVTDSIRVGLYDCRENLFVPNIITPNGDGRNDRLEIVGLGLQPWALSIYNRWGRLVYTTSWYKQDWEAQTMPAGLYYYLLQEPLTRRRVKGWVEVVR